MKTLLYTGASGFLGYHTLPLLKNYYDIKTVGMLSCDDYKVNLARDIPNLTERFDTILHAAGKAHVIPKTLAEEQAFYDINYRGTVNICKALIKTGVPKSFIFISTVAVYGCDSGENITEEYPLGGNTPYADSKKMAEEFLKDWCKKYRVILSILRPALLAGPNPPGNLGAMVEGIRTGRYFSIAGGRARKSISMVQDIGRLVPLVENKGGIYNVCDSHHPSFGELEKLISGQLGKSRPFNLPYWVAKGMALCGDCMGKKAPINSSKLNKITKSLTFSNEKAMRELGWQPLDVLSNFKIR